MSVEYLGALASLIGLPLALIGLSLTYRAAISAKTVSEAAKVAAEDAVAAARSFDAVADGSAIVSSLRDLMTLHRSGAYAQAVERYAEIRQKLIRFRAKAHNLAPESAALIQGAISTMSQLERVVDNALSKNSTPQLNLFQYNKRIAEHIEKLGELVEEVAKNGQ